LLAYESRRAHTAVIRGGQQGSSTATCPAGEHVLFGGAAGVPPSSEHEAYVLPTGMRRSADNHWTVDGFPLPRFGSVGPPQYVPGRLRSIAYCGRGPLPSKATNTARFADGRTSVIAKCPTGTVVVGGGFTTKYRNNGPFISDLERVASDKWRVSVIDWPGYGEGASLTAVAYCGTGPAPKLITTSVAVWGGKGGTAHASCPTGTALMFGGVIASPRGDHNPGAVPSALGADSNRTWSVSGFGYISSQDSPDELTALAYCR